jgi:hypothetical protein
VGPTPQAWEGEGFPILQFSQNGVSNSFGVAQNIIVPEADYPPSPGFQPSRAARVSLTTYVLTAICLDDQEAFGASKIGDETPNRELPTEFVPA